MTILINDGNVFEGTLEQFEDCFFSNASVEGIKAWAEDNSFKVEFR